MSAERKAEPRDGRDGALKGRLSPLHMLSSLGQSVWIDFLSRDSIRSGHLRGLMEGAAVVGATSNPTIFQKAMTAGSAYEEQLRELDPALETPEVFSARRATSSPTCGRRAAGATGTSRSRSTPGWHTTRSRPSARR